MLFSSCFIQREAYWGGGGGGGGRGGGEEGRRGGVYQSILL